MPTYGILILLNVDSYISMGFDTSRTLLLTSAVLIYTVLAPIISVLILLYSIQRNVAEGLQMQSRESRTFPFILTAIYYGLAYWMVLRFNVPDTIAATVLGAILGLIVTIIINFWWKISIHMVGMGGIIGVLIGFSENLQVPLLHWLMPAILITGLVGTARIYLGAHKPAQVYVGFAVGLVCEYFIVRAELVI